MQKMFVSLQQKPLKPSEDEELTTFSNPRGRSAHGLHQQESNQNRRKYEHNTDTDSGVGQDVPQE